jgi:hypothetical protein
MRRTSFGVRFRAATLVGLPRPDFRDALRVRHFQPLF